MPGVIAASRHPGTGSINNFIDYLMLTFVAARTPPSHVFTERLPKFPFWARK